MGENNKILDSGSRLLDLIRKQIPGQRGIELATVITQPPELRIRIDNMELILEKEDLIVCNNAYSSGYLSQGSRVVVMALPGEQQYLIWDKVVIP